MIILGDRHQFTKMEMEELHKRFDSIDHISYRDQDSGEIIDLIDGYITKNSKSIILLNTQARIPDELLNYLVSLESKRIRYITTESFLERYLRKCYIPEDQTNLAFLEQIRSYTPLQHILKRLTDIAGLITLGFFGIPFVLYSVYRIRKESPGPIFYTQNRVGINNREFVCYKFRSMQPNAEKDGIKFASEDDDRIFPWGHVMRKYRIDELPQLWNVIKGDMHVIGPRPERKIWIEQFQKEIPYYNERHLVRPGITGWAQVNYPYGDNKEDAKQKLMYDLYYIKYWNLWFEFKTALKTIAVMMRK